MEQIWQRLQADGSIAEADCHLARHLLALDDAAPAALGPLIALASAQIRIGNVCLPLRGDAVAAAGLAPEIEAVRQASIIGEPDDPTAPLILDGDRLYLARYHAWERQVIDSIRQRLEASLPEVDFDVLRKDLGAMFPSDAGTDWQRVAATVAVLQRFAIVSGGPGTGKTWTLARILKLLRHQPGGEGMRIGLAAPTGKAAARMTEAIRQADPALADDLDEARTLHRLLGMRPGRVQPRFGPARPLPLDLLIVDEVSMVDLPMMARLLMALPVTSRLILLGDRHQLASVEAGQVMGDLCGDGGGAYSAGLAKRVAELSGDELPVADAALPPIADHIVVLRQSRRFDATRGIGALARAVNDGDAEAALAVLQSDDDTVALQPVGRALDRRIREQVVPLFREIGQMDDPAEALALLGKLRVLCAVREGPQGMAQINATVQRALGIDHRGLYPGQPVMVTVNDYQQQLFNGDTGIVLPDEKGRLRVWFADDAGGVRAILPTRLPSHETVYAMTIHKSQGSEFDEVMIVLPDKDNPVVTRELLYTAITRARENVTVCATGQALETAIGRSTNRVSGLYPALWHP